jgi:hypothetical protein
MEGEGFPYCEPLERVERVSEGVAEVETAAGEREGEAEDKGAEGLGEAPEATGVGLKR